MKARHCPHLIQHHWESWYLCRYGGLWWVLRLSQYFEQSHTDCWHHSTLPVKNNPLLASILSQILQLSHSRLAIACDLPYLGFLNNLAACSWLQRAVPEAQRGTAALCRKNLHKQDRARSQSPGASAESGGSWLGELGPQPPAAWSPTATLHLNFEMTCNEHLFASPGPGVVFKTQYLSL